MSASARLTVSSLDQVLADFSAAQPRITRHARVFFRYVRCRHKKADCISEVVALCWKWWLSLVGVGKNPKAFVSVLASYAARAVKSGRRLCGQLKSKDVLSELAQQRHGFYVGKLPDYSTESCNPLAEALTDNTRSDIPTQVHFRCDFPTWLKTRTQRDRRIIHDMLLNTRTKDLARKHRKSEGRISQLRREYHQDWCQFTDA
jgi:hypothetical protein